MMFRRFFIVFLLALLSCAKNDEKPSLPTEVPIRALDLSFVPQMKQAQVAYRDSHGDSVNLLPFLAEKGVNYARVRLWHAPSDQHSSFQEVESLVQDLRAEGFGIWITIHYSDSWADPGHQIKPALWQGLSLAALTDSLGSYTAKIVRKLDPNIIQIGNEINDGFLWPDGQRSSNSNSFHDLVGTAIESARAEKPDIQVMLHFAGVDGAYDFFMESDTLDYDLMGLSYYPIWHGKELDQLQALSVQLKSDFKKEFVLAEFAYPFTLNWNDFTNNIVGLPEQLILPDYPASEFGQASYVQAIENLIRNGQGKGYCYWGAEWVAFDGPQSTSGSPWENQALFNFDLLNTPALDVFDKN